MSYAYEKKFDAVIVGAGVIGCSIAYSLARKSGGKMKVAVLERNSIGSETSSGSAGMLAAQIEVEERSPMLDLALESRKLFGPLAAELRSAAGVDIAHFESGILETAFTPEREAALKARRARQKSASLDCDWLSGDEVVEKFPFIGKKPLGGFWVPSDGQVSAHKLTSALSEAAKKLGVQFFETENFDELDLRPPRLESVETNLSKFTADFFIFAAGPWNGKLLKGLVPVEPVRGQILIFEIPEPWRARHSWRSPIYLGDTPDSDPVHCYLVPKDDNHVLLGATVQRRGFDRLEDEAATRKMTRYACSIFPDLADFPYKGSWVGLRPGSPDGLPLLGALDGMENAFIAGGHYRNGILLAPVTGKFMAELILDGKTSLPLDPFSPSRFRASR